MNCYNGEEFLSEAINSVLNQTYQNWELIFWDNRSLDNTSKIAKSFTDNRIKYYNSSVHTDLGEGRKRGFEKINGKFLAILDVDDIWFPDKIEKQLSSFNSPDISVSITNAYLFNNKKKIILYKNDPPSGYIFEKLLEKYNIYFSTVMFRVSSIKKLDYNFDPDFNHIADFDLVLRCLKFGRLAYCNNILTAYRLHGNNDSFRFLEKFVLERDLWIKKNKENNFIDKIKYNKEIIKFSNTNNRQKALLELMFNSRIECIKTLIYNNSLTIKDLLVIILSILPMKKSFFQKLYINRITRGLINSL